MNKKLMTLDEVMAALPEGRRRKIEERAAAELAEIRALRSIREAAGLSQAELASRLGINQTAVSKMERRKGMSMSNLLRYARAMGGNVEIAINLPECGSVKIVQKGDKYEVIR